MLKSDTALIKTNENYKNVLLKMFILWTIIFAFSVPPEGDLNSVELFFTNTLMSLLRVVIFILFLRLAVVLIKNTLYRLSYSTRNDDNPKTSSESKKLSYLIEQNIIKFKIISEYNRFNKRFLNYIQFLVSSIVIRNFIVMLNNNNSISHESMIIISNILSSITLFLFIYCFAPLFIIFFQYTRRKFSDAKLILIAILPSILIVSRGFLVLENDMHEIFHSLFSVTIMMFIIFTIASLINYESKSSKIENFIRFINKHKIDVSSDIYHTISVFKKNTVIYELLNNSLSSPSIKHNIDCETYIDLFSKAIKEQNLTSREFDSLSLKSKIDLYMEELEKENKEKELISFKSTTDIFKKS